MSSTVDPNSRNRTRPADDAAAAPKPAHDAGGGGDAAKAAAAPVATPTPPPAASGLNHEMFAASPAVQPRLTRDVAAPSALPSPAADANKKGDGAAMTKLLPGTYDPSKPEQDAALQDPQRDAVQRNRMPWDNSQNQNEGAQQNDAGNHNSNGGLDLTPHPGATHADPAAALATKLTAEALHGGAAGLIADLGGVAHGQGAWGGGDSSAEVLARMGVPSSLAEMVAEGRAAGPRGAGALGAGNPGFGGGGRAAAEGRGRGQEAAVEALLGMGARSPMALASLMRSTALSSPVLAVIAADMFRMQTARLEQLYSARTADEDGELPAEDEDEAQMRRVRIDAPHLSGGQRWDLTPEGPADDEGEAAHVAFRAALLTVALQTPQAVVSMFRVEDRRPLVRLYGRGGGGYAETWVRLRATAASGAPPTPSALDDDWLRLAEGAFVELATRRQRPVSPGDTPAARAAAAAAALETIVGRPALSLEVQAGSRTDAAALWRLLCRTSAPRNEPVLLATGAEAGADGLRAHHVYGVLGAMVARGQHLVALCSPHGDDAFAPARSVVSVPFSLVRRNAAAVALLHSARR